MAHRKKIIIGTEEFPTQGAALEFFRKMRALYQRGERVQSHHGEILMDLLRRHPNYEEKVGAGIDYFIATLARGHGTPCFAVVRIDGSKEDFSYHSGIKQKTRNH